MGKIVYPQDGWILERSGKELDGLQLDGTYIINYAYASQYDGEITRPFGAFFTHREPKTQKLFDEIAKRVDYAVCLNVAIAEYLLEVGVPRVDIIRHGYDPRVLKPIRFGWSGRKYDGVRKGWDLIERIQQAGYTIVLSGDFDAQPTFYKAIDYLLITSRIEGGPVPMIDAIAAGVPVIARQGVGWCDSFPAIRYETDDQCLDILWKLTHPPSWQEWREQHQSLFSSVNSTPAVRY